MSCGLYPRELNTWKKPFIEFKASDLKVFSNETINKTEEILLEEYLNTLFDQAHNFFLVNIILVNLSI